MPGKKPQKEQKSDAPLKLKPSQTRVVPPLKHKSYIKRLCKKHGFSPISIDAMEIPDQAVTQLVQELGERVMLMHSMLTRARDTISVNDMRLAMQSLLSSKRANAAVTQRMLEFADSALEQYVQSRAQ